MAKHRLPISGRTSDDAAVTIAETATGHLTQIAGWGNFRDAAASVLRSRSLAFPGDFRTPVRTADTTIWLIAPDRILVQSLAAFDAAASDDLAVLDLSEARVRLSVSGPGAAGLLSRVTPLDFSQAAFPTGSFAQTALHHIGVLIDRPEQELFHVLIPTTWAVSLTGLLVDHLSSAVVSAA